MSMIIGKALIAGGGYGCPVIFYLYGAGPRAPCGRPWGISDQRGGYVQEGNGY